MRTFGSHASLSAQLIYLCIIRTRKRRMCHCARYPTRQHPAALPAGAAMSLQGALGASHARVVGTKHHVRLRASLQVKAGGFFSPKFGAGVGSMD